RIVPGQPEPAELHKAWRELGYRDELLTVCEVFRLFAIQRLPDGSPRLSFAAADPNVVIADDIKPFRDRKVRLLNGTHTIMVPAALLAGCTTVAEALEDEQVGAFIRHMLLHELVASTDVVDAETFANQVLDRFANPFISHELIDITLQQTTKMSVRVVPA